jgi:asparagine synthase (glutamine-hydrolysing)
MNRIGCIYNLNQRDVDPSEINRMSSELKLELKDQSWSRIERNAGVTCVTVGNPKSTIANEPTDHHAAGDRMVVFDGRIDNRGDLIAILHSLLQINPAEISDADLVFAAFEKWGPDLPKHLIGDFAFALWDKNRDQLICVRDHFGVKPLYYSLSKDAFVCGSTPRAVLASGKINPHLNEERIADFLVYPLEGVDKSSSCYQNIFRLPPAHMLIVNSQGLTIQRYWSMKPNVETIQRSDDYYIEAFRDLFEKAVGCRLQDTPFSGSMLSGGIDSCSIVGMGRKISLDNDGPPLQVFPVTSSSPVINREPSYISSVLTQGNIQAHLVSDIELLQRLDEVVGAIECETEPFDHLMNLSRLVFLQARDKKFNAILDGVDGDLLLLGSGHLAQLWREGNFRAILQETVRADGMVAEYKMGKWLLYNSILSAYLPFAPAWFRKLRHPFRYRKVVTSAIEEKIIDPDFAESCRLGERFALLDSHNPRPRRFMQVDYHLQNMDQPYLVAAFERYERVASAFGIEARHPFIDIRLVDFCLGLPWQLKTQRGWTKYILRRAMEPYLPAGVVWRRDKDSLMWEVNRRILKEKTEYFYQITLDEKENLRPYVNIQKLEKIWNEYLTEGEEKDTGQIWSGIALAFWLRRHRNMIRDLKLASC